MTGAALPRSWDPGVYQLLDAGDGRRLERFGDHVLDRPAPAVGGTRAARGAGWLGATARFERGSRGSGRWIPVAPDPWPVRYGSLLLEARATPSGGIGIFPEQSDNWTWLASRVARRGGGGTVPEVLNLFAHTGAATLVAATAGARVVHVDASRPAVAWARRNAQASALADAPIRWIVDDALAFVRREARRGRRYDVVVLDPPSYGHGPDRRRWELEEGLPALLEACAAVLAERGAILLTAHTPGFNGARLAEAVEAAFPDARGRAEPLELTLVAASGATLPVGSGARFPGSP